MDAALSLQLTISQPLFTARLEQKQLRYFVQRPTEEAVKKHQRDSQGRAIRIETTPKYRHQLRVKRFREGMDFIRRKHQEQKLTKAEGEL